MAEISDFNVSAGSNLTRWPEGMSPSNVNDSAREDEAILARYYKDTNGSLVTAGTTTAYTVTLNSQYAAWFNGLKFRVRFNAACGATPTINPTGSVALGAKSLYWPNGVQVTTNDIPLDAVADLVYQSGGDKVYVLSLALPFTGSGSLVRSTSPTLVTPALGTPASGTLTNCTGLPPDGLSSTTGSGAVVRATSPTLVTPALGTPASGNLGNCTNLPVAQIAAGTVGAVGFSATDYSAGTKSSGTFTPDPANGNFQYAVNGGAHTLAPPGTSCTIVIQYTNNGSAGAITTSGFTKVSGDSLTTTNGDDFLLFVSRLNGFTHLHKQALQ